jgi:hypothetical protein
MRMYRRPVLAVLAAVMATLQEKASLAKWYTFPPQGAPRQYGRVVSIVGQRTTTTTTSGWSVLLNLECYGKHETARDSEEAMDEALRILTNTALSLSGNWKFERAEAGDQIRAHQAWDGVEAFWQAEQSLEIKVQDLLAA